MVDNRCEREADANQPAIDMNHDDAINNAYAQAQDGLRQLQYISNTKEHALHLIFLRGRTKYAEIAILKD